MKDFSVKVKKSIEDIVIEDFVANYRIAFKRDFPNKDEFQTSVDVSVTRGAGLMRERLSSMTDELIKNLLEDEGS